VDGGALVVLAIDQAYVVDVAAGAGAVTADADLAALAGRTQFTSSLNRRAVELLAFHVPARGARSTVTLVAASKADVSATGS
jgi:hypothetical protein